MLIAVALGSLSFFTVRGRHGTPDVPLPVIILVLDLLGILCIRRLRDLRFGLELLPFGAALLISLTLQLLFSDSYYQAYRAINASILLAAMLLCAVLLTQADRTYMVWKAIRTVNLIASVCILLQVITIPLELRLDKLGTISNWLFNAWEFTSAIRPCGPFPEPSMYAQLGLLALYEALYINKSWPLALITTAALLLSTSALAFVGVALLCGAFLLTSDKVRAAVQEKKHLLLAGFLAAVLLCAVLLLGSDLYVVQRVLSGSSIGVRLLRSVDLFSLLRPWEQLFGIGLQNQELYLNYHSITLAHDTYETLYANKEFASVLGYLSCTLGLLGLMTFLFPFLRTFFRGGIRTKVMVGLLIYVCLFCSLLSNCIFVLYIMAVYSALKLEQTL